MVALLHKILVVTALCVAVVAAAPAGRHVVTPLSHMHAKAKSPFRRASHILRTAGADDDAVDVPLGGDTYPAAIYFFELEIGTPSQSFPVALDTGSFTLDVPLKGCDGCVTTAPNNAYDPSASSTAAPLPCSSPDCSGRCKAGVCQFSNTYETCDLKNPTAGCTISGPFWTDAVSVGGKGPANVTFGSIDYQTTNFDQFKIIDGVMGIAGEKGDGNVFEQLVSGGFLGEDVFAICLHHGSRSNGTLVLGGVDDRLRSGPFQWTAMKGSVGGLYVMDLAALTVAGEDITANTENVILDSGTNVLLLPTPSFDSLRRLLTANCTTNPLVGLCPGTVANATATIFDGLCFPLTPAQRAAYPTVNVNLKGVELAMSASDYLVVEPHTHGLGNYCLGIRPTGQHGFLIVGDTIMQEFLVAFDRANGRIGWAPVSKENCGSI